MLEPSRCGLRQTYCGLQAIPALAGGVESPECPPVCREPCRPLSAGMTGACVWCPAPAQWQFRRSGTRLPRRRAFPWLEGRPTPKWVGRFFPCIPVDIGKGSINGYEAYRYKLQPDSLGKTKPLLNLMIIWLPVYAGGKWHQCNPGAFGPVLAGIGEEVFQFPSGRLPAAGYHNNRATSLLGQLLGYFFQCLPVVFERKPAACFGNQAFAAGKSIRQLRVACSSPTQHNGCVWQGLQFELGVGIR